MKTESILCGLGYTLAATIILMETGAINSLAANIMAVLGAAPVGWWCAHCDRMERR